MAKILVDKSLVDAATVAIEQANIYLQALRSIANQSVATGEGKELVEIARTAIKDAEVTGVLSQTDFD